MKRFLKKIYYFIYEKMIAKRSKKSNPQIEKYKNTHSGERCFIVCTGPSLTVDDLELIKDEFSISMNSIVNIFDKTQYRPNVFIIQDPFVFRRLENTLFDRIKDIPVKFVGSIIKYKYPTLKLPKDFLVYNLTLMNHNLLDRSQIDFSKDFSKITYDGFTVTYSAVQLAYYMGFKEIYFLGHDCNYSGEKKHFDSSMDTGFIYDNAEENMQSAYRFLKEKLRELDIKIYNATRGGSLEIFERVALEDVVKKD